MRRDDHVARMVKMRNMYNIVFENLMKGDHLEDLGVDGKTIL
jgi:hypothetical protein